MLRHLLAERSHLFCAPYVWWALKGTQTQKLTSAKKECEHLLLLYMLVVCSGASEAFEVVCA